jgi:hypothetical protein
MRTTLDINDDLFRRAKKKAAEEGIPLKRLVEKALREILKTKRSRKGYSLSWRTEKGRLQPGVRLDDRKALFDLMEGRE